MLVQYVSFAHLLDGDPYFFGALSDDTCQVGQITQQAMTHSREIQLQLFEPSKESTMLVGL